MAGAVSDRIAKLRRMADHPASNPHEAAIAATEADRLEEAAAVGVIADSLGRALIRMGAMPLPIRWVIDAEAGFAAAWGANGSPGELAARAGFGGAVRMGREGAAVEVRRAAWAAACAARPGVRSAANDMAWAVHDLVNRIPEIAPARDAGLWMFWIMAREIVAVPRPIVRIEGGRVHCATAPAVHWPGGAAYWFWNGTQIPADWIANRANLDPMIALTWPNIEQRRAAAELMGWDKVIARLPSRTVDTHPNPMVGALLEVDLPAGFGRARFLKVLCGTGRTFVLCVPRECRTALEAQVSMWPGLSESEVLAALTKGRRA